MADADHISDLLGIASDPGQLQAIQAVAAEKLYAYDGEKFPRDACAITQSLLFQSAGIHVGEIFGALEFDNMLKNRGWSRVDIGKQQPGDIGTTCGNTPHPGVDHVYLVLRLLDGATMTIADNQEKYPHTRWVKGSPDGKQSVTTYFLRAT